MPMFTPDNVEKYIVLLKCAEGIIVKTIGVEEKLTMTDLIH